MSQDKEMDADIEEPRLVRLIEDMSGSLHSQMQTGFAGLNARMDNLEKRMDSFDGNTTELVRIGEQGRHGRHEDETERA